MNKYAMETAAGVFVAIGLCSIAYMAVTLGRVPFLGENTYPLHAKFTTVSGLRTGSPVDMLGIEVGRIEQISLDQNDQLAVVRMSIQEGIRVYADAIVSIKTEGLIGDKYLSIEPGGSEELLKPGGTIIATQPAVDIVDLIGKYAFGEVKKPEDGGKTQGGKR